MAAVGIFDTAFGKIIAALNTFSAEEKVINAAYEFVVKPDYYRTANALPNKAHVFVYLGPITPEVGKTGAHRHYAFTASYYLDLIVPAKGTQGDTYTRADEAAGARLRYLIQQVLIALFRPNDRNLDMAEGTISGRPFPRIEPLPPEMQTGERPIAGARMTLDLGLAWEPGDLSGTAIDSIDVDASLFEALYEQGA